MSSVIGFNPRHTYDVRLTAEDGKQLGIYKLPDAIKIAQEQGLDLINISPHAKPPVAKIMDHGKFKYKQKLADKEARKKQHVVQIKEIKFGIKIEEHDFNVKLSKIKDFLAEGSRVRVVVQFRGREIVHPDIGVNLLKKVVEMVKDAGVAEGAPISERKEMAIMLKSTQTKAPVKTELTPPIAT